MPLVRFKIRNELSLGKPELNRSAAVENEEPKAILAAVEVAGLVGILRQLGDLAEFSAEVFNGIQEEVTVTASRCQKLTSRVKRIESALSPLEKAVLSQTSHIHFAYTAGCEWHPRIRNGRSHFVQTDLPLCVMETYEQCRDPPPLHLLDRFDLGGPGSCLRKYSDPTFFKKNLSNPSKADDVKVQRDQAHRKRKKKRLPERNICRSRAVSTSEETNGTRISSLIDDKQTATESTSTVDMPRSSNLQELSDIVDQSHLQEHSDIEEHSETQVQSDFIDSSKPRDSITGSGYIEYVINQSPVNKPEVKLVDGFLSGSQQPADKIGSAVPESCIEVVDDNILYNSSEDLLVSCASSICDEKKATLESRFEKSNKVEEMSEIHESKIGPGTPDRVRQNQRDFDRTDILFDEVDIVEEKQSKSQANFFDGALGTESEGENKSEQGSDSDEFVDARNTIESESESEHDGVPKPNLEHYFGDISTYCSEDANSDNNDGSEDIPYESMAEDPHHDYSLDESCSGSYFSEDTNVSCSLSDPVCGKAMSHDEVDQKPKEFVAMSPSVLAEEFVPDISVLRDESVAADPFLAGDYADEKISFEEPISPRPSLEDDMPTEKVLQEGHLANYSFFTEAVPQEKIFPEDQCHDDSLNESCLGLYFPEDANVSCFLSDPVSEKAMAHDDTFQNPKEFVAMSSSLLAKETVPDKIILQEEPVATYPLLAGDCADEKISFQEPIAPRQSLEDGMPTEKISPEGQLANYSFFTEAVPQEKILAEDPCHHDDVSCSGSYFAEDANASGFLSEPVYEEALSHDDTFHQPKDFFAMSPSLLAKETVPDKVISQEEPVAAHPLLAGDCASEVISSEKPMSPSPSLKDAKILPEGHFTSFSFFTEAVLQEKILPEESVAKYQSLAEVNEMLPQKALPDIPSLAEVAPDNMTTPAEEPDVAHPSFSKAVQDEKNSLEAPDSKNLCVAEAVLQERNSLNEFVAVYPYLAEAVPDERVLIEEPASMCLSSAKAMPIENVPEKPLGTYNSLAELRKENNLQEKSDDATHPSCVKAAPEENISAEVLDSTKFSAAETVPEEKISVEEVSDIDQCLAEAVLGETLLPEEPVTTCMSLKRVMTIEKTLTEEPMEMHPSMAELPEEEILDEDADDATHTAFSQAVSDEKISPEVLDFTYMSLPEASSLEPISHEEIVGIYPCYAEAVPDERLLPEESVTTCLSMTKAVAIEKVLPEEPLETYPSVAELPEEKISDEEVDDVTHPSFSQAVSDVNISPEVLDSTNLSLEEAVTQEQFLLEESDGRGLPEEPVTTCMSLTKVVPIKNVLQEKPLEADASPEIFPNEMLSQENSDKAKDLSSAKAVDDEKVSPENRASTKLSVAEAMPKEQVSLEEFVGIDPCLAEDVPDERVLPEEPVTTCLSAPIENSLPEEPLEVYHSLEEMPEEKILQEEGLDDAADPSFSENGSDEKISPQEGPVSTFQSVEESVLHEETSHKELVGTNLFSDSVVLDERIVLDGPNVAYQSSPEAVSKEMNLREEPPTYPSLGEAVPNENISQEEPDATCLPSAEAVFDEKISGSEAPNCTTETGRHKETFPEIPIATDLSFSEVVFDEISGSESPGSTTETGPYNKTFPEEPVATDMFLAEAVMDEKISGSEGPGSTREAGPHDRTSSEEPAVTDLLLGLAVPDEPDVTYQSSAEAVSKEKNLPEEPLPTYPSLGEAIPDEEISVEEPDEKIPLEESDATCSLSAEIIFDGNMPGSEAPGSTTEAGLHSQTFPEETAATDLSLAEVVSDEEIPGSISPRSTTETGPHNKTFPEELVATDLSLVENVFDEKISDSVAPSSTREAGAHDEPSSEEPVVTALSLAEPVPDDNILPKEPAAAYLDLAEGIPDQQVFLDDAAFLSFAEAIFAEKFSPEVPDSTYPPLTEPEMPVALPSLHTAPSVSTDKKSGPLGGGTVTVSPDTQDPQSNGTSVEPVSIWSNGGLFGLAPLKPPVFAAPTSVSEYTQNQINEAKQESSSRSVEDNTEKSSLSLVVSDPTSQQHSKIVSNGSHSPLQSTPTSFKVFGLSHKLLMAGFRGNSSSTCKFEAIPSTSYDTKVAAIEDNTQQTRGGSRFDEQLNYESSLFGSPSPPAEHMKISFHTKDVSSVSKLKLRIPNQSQHNGEFPSFQLVPETSNSDDESDIFCQSSPCVSDNCLSDSELWESDESPRKSVSSLQQEAREISRHSEIGSFSGSFLDLPCFDSVDHHQSTSSRTEQEQEQEQEQVLEYKRSVSDIIRAWPPNNPKAGPSSEANTLQKKTQNQSAGLINADDES